MRPGESKTPDERLATPVELELVRIVRERMDAAPDLLAWEREQAEWWDEGASS